MTPRPAHASHGSLNASSRPMPNFLRVICTKPREVTSATWCLVRSRLRHSIRRRCTDLWDQGKFATTLIASTTSFSTKYPKAVEAVLEANLDALQLIESNPQLAKELSQKEIAKQTGKTLANAVLERAWSNLKFDFDPLAKTLQKSAQSAVNVGQLKLPASGLKGIYDLTALNNLVAKRGLPAADDAGLGK